MFRQRYQIRCDTKLLEVYHETFSNTKLTKVSYETSFITKLLEGFVRLYGNFRNILKYHEISQNSCGTFFFFSVQWLGPTIYGIRFFHAHRSCTRWNRPSPLHWRHSVMSSSHSLHGRPLRDFPSILPNIRCFISLQSPILQMWPNNFSFLFLMIIMTQQLWVIWRKRDVVG